MDQFQTLHSKYLTLIHAMEYFKNYLLAVI